MSAYLRPRWYLLGVLLGFLCCSAAGYFVSTKARLNHFTRFFLAIAPQTFYYPTASELLMTARHEASRDKILVLLGGSSILRGAGQNDDELWSTKLQTLLGNQYKVLNFASDSASASSFGGVVYRMLRKEYPRMIFVAGTAIFNPAGSIDGLEPYNYLFWDAYYKNLFQLDEKEMAIAKRLRKEQIITAKGAEQHIMCFLDSLFYFKNLWNWVSYRLVFTVWSEHEWNKPFWARRRHFDKPSTAAYKKLLIKTFDEPAQLESNAKLLHDIVKNLIVDVDKKPLKVNDETVLAGRKGYEEFFQPQDRSKVLCLQTTYNTRDVLALPRNFQRGYWALNSQAHQLLKSLGYSVLTVGKNFSREDYVDISHFSASGGEKLAKQVAQKVKLMTVANGYGGVLVS